MGLRPEHGVCHRPSLHLCEMSARTFQYGGLGVLVVQRVGSSCCDFHHRLSRPHPTSDARVRGQPSWTGPCKAAHGPCLSARPKQGLEGNEETREQLQLCSVAALPWLLSRVDSDSCAQNFLFPSLVRFPFPESCAIVTWSFVFLL